jgi:hypothetical protein
MLNQNYPEISAIVSVINFECPAAAAGLRNKCLLVHAQGVIEITWYCHVSFIQSAALGCFRKISKSGY